MRPGIAAITVRLQAVESSPRPGEVRLVPPLSVGPLHSGDRELPSVAPPVGMQAIEAVHDLRRNLSKANADPVWWYLPVAEWQPFMSSLPAAQECGARLETLAMSSQGEFLLAVPDAVVADYLFRYFNHSPAVQIVASWRSRLTWALDRAKDPIRRIVNAAAWLIENGRAVAAVRRLRRRRNPTKQVDTLFVSRLERNSQVDAGGKWIDRYLGSMPEDGWLRMASVALLLRCGGAAPIQSADVARFGRFPVSTIFDWLTLSDVAGAMWSAWRFRLQTGPGVSALAKPAATESRKHVRALADWLLLERAAINCLHAFSPRLIVCMQENSNWEYAIVRAAQAVVPKACTVGFFHCPVLPSSFRYRTSADIREQRPHFQRTIPLGPAMRNALLSLGEWGRLIEGQGYAFRNPQLDECFLIPPRPPGQPVKILVPLGGIFDNARFLRWLDRATAEIGDVEFIIKPHPAYDAETTLASAGISMRQGRFVFSEHCAMDAALAHADIMIYKGTTVCFAALAAGVPVIHVGDGGIASDNALFDAGDLAVSVSTSAALRGEIDRIRHQSPAAKQEWAIRSRAYVRAYYELSPQARVAVLDQLFPESAFNTAAPMDLKESHYG